MFPHIMKDCTVFVDGRGMAGRVTEMTPPKVTVTTDDYRPGGYDAPVEVDMGMEKMVASFTLAENDPDVLRLYGLTSGADVGLTFRASEESETGAVRPVVAEVRGLVKEVDLGTWKPGEKGATKFEVACRYYKATVDSEDVWEIDIPNGSRKVGGVDQLEARRTALGL